jgi:hypothetical protein
MNHGDLNNAGSNGQEQVAIIRLLPEKGSPIGKRYREPNNDLNHKDYSCETLDDI